MLNHLSTCRRFSACVCVLISFFLERIQHQQAHMFNDLIDSSCRLTCSLQCYL
jgi:hypothetical protein